MKKKSEKSSDVAENLLYSGQQQSSVLPQESVEWNLGSWPGSR